MFRSLPKIRHRTDETRGNEMTRKKAEVLMKLQVPEYIQEIFRAADVSAMLAEQHSKAQAEFLAKAWTQFEQIYPQVEGYFYSYDRNGIMSRHVRPVPEKSEFSGLTQK